MFRRGFCGDRARARERAVERYLHAGRDGIRIEGHVRWCGRRPDAQLLPLSRAPGRGRALALRVVARASPDAAGARDAAAGAARRRRGPRAARLPAAAPARRSAGRAALVLGLGGRLHGRRSGVVRQPARAEGRRPPRRRGRRRDALDAGRRDHAGAADGGVERAVRPRRDARVDRGAARGEAAPRGGADARGSGAGALSHLVARARRRRRRDPRRGRRAARGLRPRVGRDRPRSRDRPRGRGGEGADDADGCHPRRGLVPVRLSDHGDRGAHARRCRRGGHVLKAVHAQPATRSTASFHGSARYASRNAGSRMGTARRR